MLQNNNRDRILNVFFDDPLGEFKLREISRKGNVAPPSVKGYLNGIKKDELILSTSHKLYKYPIYRANQESPYFRFLKKINLVKELYPAVEQIRKSCLPDCIILYGSASMGEDTKESDIDVFILSSPKDLRLERFERALNRKFHCLFRKSFDSLSSELKNNILNGYVLYGYITVFDSRNAGQGKSKVNAANVSDNISQNSRD